MANTNVLHYRSGFVESFGKVLGNGVIRILEHDDGNLTFEVGIEYVDMPYNKGRMQILKEYAQDIIPDGLSYLGGTSYRAKRLREEVNQECEEEDESVADLCFDPESYPDIGERIGKLVAEKQKAYGMAVDVSQKVLQAFLEQYEEIEGYYVIPKELLPHMLLQTRIIDKQCRIFANPSGDLMDESPYGDIAGYGILGVSSSGK